MTTAQMRSLLAMGRRWSVGAMAALPRAALSRALLGRKPLNALRSFTVAAETMPAPAGHPCGSAAN